MLHNLSSTVMQMGWKRRPPGGEYPQGHWLGYDGGGGDCKELVGVGGLVIVVMMVAVVMVAVVIRSMLS